MHRVHWLNTLEQSKRFFKHEYLFIIYSLKPHPSAKTPSPGAMNFTIFDREINAYYKHVSSLTAWQPRVKEEIFFKDCINLDGFSPTPQVPRNRGHQFNNFYFPLPVGAKCQIRLKEIKLKMFKRLRPMYSERRRTKTNINRLLSDSGDLKDKLKHCAMLLVLSFLFVH